jgi:hypothetical protein
MDTLARALGKGRAQFSVADFGTLIAVKLPFEGRTYTVTAVTGVYANRMIVATVVPDFLIGMKSDLQQTHRAWAVARAACHQANAETWLSRAATPVG